jgi:hypothetical protein
MFVRPVDAAATEEADIMGAGRVEPFKREVSRRSVVGSGAKLAYASPLVAASFSLSPTFGYMRAAAYFKENKQAKKPAPQPGSDPIPPPPDDSLYLPTNGGDGQVIDVPTPPDAGGSEAGDPGDGPTFSVAKIVICHAVCTNNDPHRPLAYRLIELADDPDAWDTHVSQDHGKRMCAKDEDVILGPANSGYTEKDCPGNRISGP